MSAHGLKSHGSIYTIPDGAKYIVVVPSGDYRTNEMLQDLGAKAVQIVIDDRGMENVFVWYPAFTEAQRDKDSE